MATNIETLERPWHLLTARVSLECPKCKGGPIIAWAPLIDGLTAEGFAEKQATEAEAECPGGASAHRALVLEQLQAKRRPGRADSLRHWAGT